MASSPSLNIQVSVTGSNAGSGALGSVSEAFNIQSMLQLLPGTAAGQANLVFAGTRTLAASTGEDLDLNGSLKDDFGTATNFLHVKAILVRAAASNVNAVVVGGASATQFVGPFGAATHTIAVQPGEVFLITNATGAGWPVVAGTSDFLHIANGGAGTAVVYDVLILGVNA